MPEPKKKSSMKRKKKGSKSKSFGGLDSFIGGKQKKSAEKTKPVNLKKTPQKIPVKEEKEKKIEIINKTIVKTDVKFKGSLTPSKVVKKKSKPINRNHEMDQDKSEPEKTEQEKGNILKKIYFQKNPDPIGDSRYSFIKRDNREQQKSWHLRFLSKENEIIQDMDKGILLTVDYDGGYNKAFAKFLDLSDNSIKIWIDTTNHEPYCYSKDEKEDIEDALSGFGGFDRIEDVKKFDLLEDKLIDIRKIYGITPTDIGGTRGIREELGGAWEARIRYHHNFIYDRNLIPGMLYKIDKGNIIPIKPQIDKKIETKLLEVFQDAPTEMKEMAKLYQPIFSSPTTSLLRMAYDIEVEESPDGGLPNPMLAKQKVISISFAATDGLKKVYCLDRDDLKLGIIPEDFPKNSEYFFFKEERELLKETFRLFWKYPIIITFNGDNFDNTYLFHRARRLKIKDEENPIYLGRGGGMVTHNTDFKHAVHIDIFQFFANRSIKGYAFGGSYLRNSLEEVSSSLLGSGKIKHEGVMIGEMTLANLIHYNMIDSIRTLELTTFNNNLVWNLIFVLMRITKLPLQDIFRLQISAWIRSLFYYEHRRKNYLIPRGSDLEKRGHFSRADTSKFQGAYVIDPIPGIHFKVAVLDFSSLYPSVIKTRNLSYETVKCLHPSCQDNMLENTPYWACSKKMGIFAYVVGYLRDIRAKWYKPMSSDKSLSVQKREAANVMTSALKVFINGAYGVFGSTAFPLYYRPVAEATTAISRFSIQQTIDKAKSMNVEVLYGDTDSVFLLHPSKQQIEELIQWSTRELDLELELEKTYQFLALSSRKKNYIGVRMGGQKVDLKGLMFKKHNTPNFIKIRFKEVQKILTKIVDMETFNANRKKIIKIIKRTNSLIGKTEEKGGFNIEDYGITIVLKRKLSDYKSSIPQHVRVANMMSESEKKNLGPGSFITYIKTRTQEKVKPINKAKINDIDYKKYKELVRSAFEQVLDALDISYEEILGTVKLSSFFN